VRIKDVSLRDLGTWKPAEVVSSEHTVENTWLVMGILLAGFHRELQPARGLQGDQPSQHRRLPLPRFLRESRHSEILIIFAEDTCAVVGLLLAMGGTMLATSPATHLRCALGRAHRHAAVPGRPLPGPRTLQSAHRRGLRRKTRWSSDEPSTVSSVAPHQPEDRPPGPDDLLVTAKVELADHNSHQAADLINTIEQDIRASLPQYKIYIYIEQDKFVADYHR
jgi:hypothetical protein